MYTKKQADALTVKSFSYTTINSGAIIVRAYLKQNAIKRLQQLTNEPVNEKNVFLSNILSAAVPVDEIVEVYDQVDNSYSYKIQMRG